VIASEKYKQMEPGELLPPNKQKIDQLFANLKTGETEDILSACESFIVEDEFFSMGRNSADKKKKRSKQTILFRKRRNTNNA